MNTTIKSNQQMSRFQKFVVANRGFKWRDVLIALVFLLPALLHFAIFKYYPVGHSFVLSLHRGNLMNPFERYLGIYHYDFLLNNDYFWQGILNSFVYTLGRVPLGAAISLALALPMASILWRSASF